MNCETNPNVCHDCAVNHIKSAANDKCTCSIDKCVSCSILNSDVCDKCQDGYNFDQAQMKCLCNINNC